MATSYQWVRHLGAVTPTGGITSSVSNAFAAYTLDNYFGIRTIISPLPSVANKDYTWRQRAYRDTIDIIDIEWKYRIVGTTPTLFGRAYNNGVPGTYQDYTATLAGMPGGTLVLDSVISAASSFIGQDPDFVEDTICGTTTAHYDRKEDGVTVAGGIGVPAGVLGIGGFDIRALAVKNLRADKVLTNLSSDENTVNIKGDIMALPASTSLFPSGWTPASNATVTIQILNYSTDTVYWSPPTGTATVTTAVAGKVAEINLDNPGMPGRWNGKMLGTGDCIGGFSLVTARAVALNPDSLSNSTSRTKANGAITYNCPKEEFGANDQGLSLDTELSYTAFDFAKLPASLGFGWASEASSRVIIKPGELIFRSASGSYLRWLDQSGTYVPFVETNYTTAVVDPGSTNARYKLTFKDQTVFEFDTTGKLKRQVDRNGNAISYSHNATTGFLETISDGNGHSQHFINRADGQPLTMRINNATTGRLTQFLYYSASDPDSPNRLFRTIDPELNETDFYYYPNGQLQAVINPEFNVASVYGYDNLGRLYTEELFGEVGRIHFHGYNSATGRTSHEVLEQDLVTGQAERSRYTELDALGNIVRELVLVSVTGSTPYYNETLMEYNDPNNPYLLTKRIDPNLTFIEMTYTANGNLKTITDKDGNVTTYTFAEEIDSPLNPKHRNLVRQVQRPAVTVNGSLVTYNPTILAYDVNGNLNKVTDAAGNETLMTYAADGRVTTVTDRRGNTSEFAYQGLPFSGSSRNLIQTKTPKGNVLADGFRTVTFAYGDGYDNVTSVEDDLGNEMFTTYDGLDRPLTMTDPLGEITTLTYANTLLEEILAPPNIASGALERKTNMLYDGSNRLQQIDRDVNGSGGQQTRVGYSYTGFSQLSALTRFKNGTPKSFTFSYDRLGRQVSSADTLAVPGVSTACYEPYCNSNATTSARGIRRKMTMDNRCLLRYLDVGDVDPGDPLEILNPREAREWDYDELGRMVSSKQTRSSKYNEAVIGIDIYGGIEERTYLYDELDRLVQLTFEDGSTMVNEYDFEGNITKTTDPAGKVTRYAYFRDNLLKTVTIERVSHADRAFTYSYDLAGRLLAIVYPTDTQIVAKFDDGTATPGSGWDAKGQLKHLRYEKNGTLIRRFEYGYDASGNRTSQLDVTLTQAIKWEYSYDWLDRLSSVRRATAATVGALPGTLPTVSIYTYDASDNRVTFEMPQALLKYRYVVDDADNLTEIHLKNGAAPEALFENVGKDADGNLTNRTKVSNNEVTTYQWDDFDRLIKVSSAISGVPTTTFKEHNRYDASGIRKRKLDKNGNNSREYTTGISTAFSKTAAPDSNAPTISYLVGHQVLGAEVNGAMQFFLGDALGSVRQVVDDFGTVIRTMEFAEHGQLMSSSGGGTFSPKTYQGTLSVNDDTTDSGLYLMGHRHFESSTLGRFLNRDPIGFAGGLNLFNGAGTSPVTLSDPLGLAPLEGADTVFEYGFPNAMNPYNRTSSGSAPVWIPKKNPPGRDPNYAPKAPHMKLFNKPRSAAYVWNQLGGSNCKTGQKCFMVCTQNVAPSDGLMFAHAFLVFGPQDKQVYGLWQGDQLFNSSIRIDNWNANAFRNPQGLNVQCRLYCDDQANVERAHRIAAAGTGHRTYVAGESNLWVRLVLQQAGISQWSGYDIVFPAP